MAETIGSATERRKQIRFYGAFPALVRGLTDTGQNFATHTLVDNISHSGLFLQLPRILLPRTRLFALIRLPGGAGLAVRGRIIRKETKPYGLTGVAVCFSRTHLMPAPTAL